MDRRRAFSVIEVVVIAVIVAALMAAVMPQFSAPNDGRESTLKFNLHMVRTQIEAYKAEHNGCLPVLARFAEQLTGRTDANGSTTGEKLDCGPYFQGQLPVNPYNNSGAVVAVAVAGQPPKGELPGGAGWQYDQSTGGFWPNHREYFADRPSR